jgi:hypothetical protein
MRLVLLAVLLLAGCQPEHEDFPRVPGGGGGGGGTGGGGGGGGNLTDAAEFTGRVCLVDDLRLPDDVNQCRNTGASGFTVTLGTETATTLADGTFTMTESTGEGLVWHVSGATIVTSVMSKGPSNVIPAITSADYQTLLDANLIAVQAGQGSIVARIIDNASTPLVDAQAATTPAAAVATRYDGASDTIWNLGATGPLGMAWLVGVPAGLPVLAVTPLNQNAQTTNIAVESGAITFGTFQLQ